MTIMSSTPVYQRRRVAANSVNVTADLMGDPTPEYRLRRAEIDPLIEAHDLYTRRYQIAYAAGYRARKV